jgi:hypothetical protein
MICARCHMNIKTDWYYNDCFIDLLETDIVCGDCIRTVFNRKWHEYTIPLTEQSKPQKCVKK